MKMRGSTMQDSIHVGLVLHLAACLCHASSIRSDVRMPPCITKSHPKTITLFERGEALTLECRAEGTPAPIYEWKKNGFQLNTTLSRIRIGSNGTMTINGAEYTDEGYYQCFAISQYGTAVSNMIDVRMAFLNTTVDPTTVHQKSVVAGMPFYIQADRDRSFPTPRYQWSKSYDVNALFFSVWLSTRIQQAENGDLHFAYALPEDISVDRIFRCSITNPYSYESTIGCYTKLTMIRNSTDISEFAPTLAFSSATETAVFIGKSISLRCFFYGCPEPEISWIRVDEPVGKYWRSNFDTKLTIDNITASDEGDFICRASNSQGVREHSLHISVEAEPKFPNMRDGPYNINVTEGESVTFNCSPSAKPVAKIVWLRNGQPINTDNPPMRIMFSNDNRSLTIRNVCRDCVDRESKTDLMVIQCNASNVHGYAFAQGYLNVLMKTGLMIRGSKHVSVDFLEQKHFTFQCIVTSDPSTPTTVRWYKTEPYNDLVRNELPYVFVDNEFLIIMVYPNCSSECAKYLGEYRCVGDDGYSQENQTIALNYQFMPPTETFIVQKEESWTLWKTLMCAGAFGLLLFLIGLFAGLRSKRSLGGLKKRIFDRRNDHEEYDSVDLPPRTVEETGESMPGECGEYGHVGYDSIDQVLRDVAQREGPLPNLPDVHGQNKYETIILCPGPNEAISTDRQSTFGEDTLFGDKGYCIQFEEVANGEKIDDDTVSGDQRYSVVFEEVMNDVKIDDQHAHGYESVKNGYERFPKSDDRTEESLHRYSDMIPVEVYPNFYPGKLESKETNSYLVLFAEKVSPCVDPSSKGNDSYLDLIAEELDQSIDLGSFDLGRKEFNPQSDLGLKEANPFSEIVSEEGSKKENSETEIDSKKASPSLEIASKEEHSYSENEK